MYLPQNGISTKSQKIELKIRNLKKNIRNEADFFKRRATRYFDNIFSDLLRNQMTIDWTSIFGNWPDPSKIEVDIISIHS